MRAPRRPMRPIRQPAQPLRLVPAQPPMHRLPRHVEPTRNLNNRNTITNDRQHGLIPLLHDTHLHKHAQECHGSGEATVTHQVKPCHPQAGAKMSRIRWNQTATLCARRDSNPQPAG